MTRYLSKESLSRALPVPVNEKGWPKEGFVTVRETGQPGPTLYAAAKRGALTLYHYHRTAYWDLSQIQAFIESRHERRRKKK